MVKSGLSFKEEFLHYLWRMKRFSLSKLRTTEGAEIQLYELGTYNTDGGPDFTNARLQIGDTTWAGNVEMHLYTSDWQLHKHQHNRAYDNVILHVVYEEDAPIFRKNGERLPCLELKGRFEESLVGRYRRLLANTFPISCTALFFSVPKITRTSWLERMLAERIEAKAEHISSQLEANNKDWEETFYQCLAANFGIRINAQPFDILTRSLPQRILAKHRNNLFQLEALLFGQAGFLMETFEDDYPKRLQQEYYFLRKKYTLKPIHKSMWKFLRLRPANFPTLRLAQFAQLIHQSQGLFSWVLEADTLKEFEAHFSMQASAYWDAHYVFDKPSKHKKKVLGQKTIHLIIINTVVPFLFLYGKLRDEEIYKDKALQWLDSLPAENNHIIREWASVGCDIQSAYQTQGLIQLRNEYCLPKKCLQCAIGCAIMK